MSESGVLQDRWKTVYGPEGEVYQAAPPVPKNMMVELSNACNHACIFCTNPHMQRKKGWIEGDLMRRIMGEARQLGTREIGFYTTGDPFMHKQLESFTRQAAELGFEYIYISTNGALASPERAKAVLDAGMHSIKFSINAGSRESYKLIHGHDDWDKVIANLTFISEYRKTLGRPLRLFVTYVVTKQNEHEVEQAKALLEPLVDEVHFFSCGNQISYMSAAFELLAPTFPKKLAHQKICAEPFNRLHVTYEGYLTLCCVDYQNFVAVADLKTQSLLEAWHSAEFRDIRQRHLEERLEGTLCGNCWQGRNDEIQPLRPEFATPLDQDRFYAGQVEKVQKRLKVVP